MQPNCKHFTERHVSASSRSSLGLQLILKHEGRKMKTVYFFFAVCNFLHPYVLKINCESEDDVEQVETCPSIKYIEFGCVWTNTDLFIPQLN